MTSQPGLQTTAIQIMANISQSKGNQSMKFGQLIEYNKRNIFSKIMQKTRQGDQFQTFSYLTCHTVKTNCIKLQTTVPETSSILIFQKRIWDQILHQILCLVFQEKCLLCQIILTAQNSLPDCLYFLGHWAICVLQLFVNQAMTSQNLKLTLPF